MRNIELAVDYLYRAKRCLKEARMALEDGDAPGVVRRSQEALELAVKAVLRALTIEYPRVHDVSDVLQECRSRFPAWFRDAIDELATISSELALARGPSMYGDEERGIPASELFSRVYAEEALRKAEKVLELCSKLAENLT